MVLRVRVMGAFFISVRSGPGDVGVAALCFSGGDTGSRQCRSYFHWALRGAIVVVDLYHVCSVNYVRSTS